VSSSSDRRAAAAAAFSSRRCKCERPRPPRSLAPSTPPKGGPFSRGGGRGVAARARARARARRVALTPPRPRRFVLFRTRGAPGTAPLHVGALHPDGAHVADISAAFADDGAPALTSMRVFLEAGDKGRAVAAKALAAPAYLRKLEHVDLRAPIYDP